MEFDHINYSPRKDTFTPTERRMTSLCPMLFPQCNAELCTRIDAGRLAMPSWTAVSGCWLASSMHNYQRCQVTAGFRKILGFLYLSLLLHMCIAHWVKILFFIQNTFFFSPKNTANLFARLASLIMHMQRTELRTQNFP